MKPGYSAGGEVPVLDTLRRLIWILMLANNLKFERLQQGEKEKRQLIERQPGP
ncbi:hypothetical protein LguiA_002038 [Lonicera macranthoides]